MSKYGKIKKTLGKTSDGSTPKNKDLYRRIQNKAKQKFDRWPSAYASAWVVKEYKRRGGSYS